MERPRQVTTPEGTNAVRPLLYPSGYPSGYASGPNQYSQHPDNRTGNQAGNHSGYQPVLGSASAYLSGHQVNKVGGSQSTYPVGKHVSSPAPGSSSGTNRRKDLENVAPETSSVTNAAPRVDSQPSMSRLPGRMSFTCPFYIAGRQCIDVHFSLSMHRA